MKLYYLLIISLLLFYGCDSKKTELLWNQSFYALGSQSSPRTTDLNGDGILDIVIGAGRAEMAPIDQGTLAIDGNTGELLWQHAAPAHVVGSATFQDINEDGTEDVIIGGRGGFLTALDGKTGVEIWKYDYKDRGDPILKYARFNFYNSVLVPDQNKDGLSDLLTVNGGNWEITSGEIEGRLPGVLILLDSKNGEIIAADTMPDGKESYLSPLSFSQASSQETFILFGTGGETVSGNLYLATLNDLKNQQLSNAKILVSEKGHGFIAPPSLADINGDDYLDIIAISHACKVTAVDGKTYEILWQQSFEGMESSTSLAVGYFTKDQTPDLLAVMMEGVWPNYSNTHQVLLNGKDGSIAFQERIGCFSLSSPIVYDLDNDGYDEAILSTNLYDCDIELTEEVLSPPSIHNQLYSIDFQTSNTQIIDKTENFRNIFSTPWLGDLDQDGYLDIIYCQFFNPDDLKKYLGMNMKRISTSIPMNQPPNWGAYMGTNGDGLFPL